MNGGTGHHVVVFTTHYILYILSRSLSSGYGTNFFKMEKRRKMNRVAILFVVLTIFLQTPSTNALELHPNRVRLLIHAQYDVNEQLDVRTTFIPAGNLLGELAPIIYTGVAYQLMKWFELEMDFGWVFQPNEPLISIKPSFNFGNFWAWSELEVQFPGPNVLLRFGDHVGTDLALHFRNLPQDGDGVEFFTRFHLFF
ncbi:MAG: hypothetical protein HYV41_01945 [Candidatus Magasanikbacteria bacterium]|nr:hypothetical protein [Candidatus Magasanikbacteria bacterium]